MELIGRVEAYYTSKESRYPILQKANILIAKIRYLFRLGHELNFYTAGHLRVLSEQLDEIGRRVGAWIRSLKK